MAFHDVIFPEAISYGSRGGPKFSTTVITLASGKERRNQNWIDVRAEYDVSHGIKDRSDMDELREFFYARRGRAHSFRFYDHADHSILNQGLGLGDGVTKDFQIYKTYSLTHNPYNRQITKPIDGTVVAVTVGATEMIEVDWSATLATFQANINALPLLDRPKAFGIDYSSGIVHFGTAPANGAQLEIGAAEFHVHTRFDTDEFDASHDFWETQSWDSIMLLEIKGAL